MAKVEPDAFVEIETAMFVAMAGSFKRLNKKWLRGIKSAVADEDFQEARAQVDDLNLNEVFTKNKKRLTILSWAAHNFGVSQLVDLADQKSKPRTDKRIERSIDTLENMILRAEIWTKQAALKAIDREEERLEEERRQKADKTTSFVSFIDGATERAGLNSLQITAALHNNRLASYGFLTESRLTGNLYYTINAVLDGRTSDICQEMHGKTFPVQPAYDFITDVLDIDDPEMIKEMAPFPTSGGTRPEEVGAMSNEQITQNGWMLPPYHPNCRTTIAVTSDVEGAQPIPTPEQEANEFLENDDARRLASALGIEGFVVNLGVAAGVVLGTRLLLGEAEEIRSVASMVPPDSLENVVFVNDAIERGDSDVAIMDALDISFDELEEIKDFLDELAV